jgi:hypothetical protein
MLTSEDEEELENYRLMWEYYGRFEFVAFGFRICSARNVPIPPWMFRPIADALNFTMVRGGADGQGKGGGYSARSEREAIHAERWRAMRDAIDRGCSRPSADAAEGLRGTTAQGTARQILASYKRAERLRSLMLETRALREAKAKGDG